MSELFFDHLQQKIMPVITVPADNAVQPMIDAIVAGGCNVLEITLRTDAGLQAIHYARSQYPNILVGAGSVLSPAQWNAAAGAGAQFLVSPGATPALYSVYQHTPLPWLPGVANASDLMQAYESGLTRVKFFPAETLGGLHALANYAAVFPMMKFCPTGGIRPDTVWEWLSHEHVFAAGGSWFTPKALIEVQDWSALESHISKFWQDFLRKSPPAVGTEI